jgi:hypothetical protein
MFEGTGNVVQESANLFWDNTNGRLGIGTSSPTQPLEIVKNQNALTQINLTNTTSGNIAGPILNLTSDVASGVFQFGKQSTTTGTYKTIGQKDGFIYNGTGGDISLLNDFATGKIKFTTGGVSTAQMTLFSTGNVGINTTTDAGFKLDVNGTARVRGTGTTSATTALTIQNSAGAISLRVTDDGSVTNYGKNAITTNTAFGIGALIKVTFGSLNSAFGQDALNGNTGGQANNAFGRESLLSNTSGNFNAGFGNQALLGNTTGSSNSAFGLFALSSNSTGASNSALGYNTQTGNFSGSVILGRDAVANGANQFVVGSTGTNAGLVDTAVVVPDKRWKVKINGVDYYIALQTI